ncbi:MAG: HTH domain-containing protein [Parvibaculaceae bacterium]
MSLKRGKVLPGQNDRENVQARYADIVAAALRAEFGNSRRTVKAVMRWTGVTERTAKQWLAGYNGPLGRHLIVLMEESEMVFETVLMACGRTNALAAARTIAAHGTLIDAWATMERLRADPYYAKGEVFLPTQAGRIHDRDDRANDRVNGPDSNQTPDILNQRQRWYVEALAAGTSVRAKRLAERWRMSEKTARRDIAKLKMLGVVEFVGSPKAGRYRLARG